MYWECWGYWDSFALWVASTRPWVLYSLVGRVADVAQADEVAAVAVEPAGWADEVVDEVAAVAAVAAVAGVEAAVVVAAAE